MVAMRRRFRFHGLKRPKVRQDMNKYNFYNLSRLTVLNAGPLTYFQQKWKSKAATRCYHAEQVKEKQWQRMFSRTCNAVVPMSPDYLARNDGSEMAAGRGSGLQPDPSSRVKAPPRTPYMQMMYHPTERRLDTAIFRALFASSARQARQFVVHGHVKVNGKRMVYPGYLLNPGDMYQVEPDLILFATGASKDSPASSSDTAETAEGDESDQSSESALGSAVENVVTSIADNDPEAEEDDIVLDQEIPDSEDNPTTATLKILQSLGTRIRSLLEDSKETLSGQKKIKLRALKTTVTRTMSRAASTTPTTLDDLETQFQSLSSTTSPSNTESEVDAVAASAALEETPEMRAAIQTARDNPIDPSKPYATPWRPRDFMSAFAFIPRYLEVNQNICSAVYLRHPVCMPGFAEVPTPFHHETSQLAFNWYLRRR